MKETFAAKMFASKMFACGMFAGLGADIDVVVGFVTPATVRRSPTVIDTAVRRGLSSTDTPVRRAPT
jgi:hypothetical protein